MIIRILGNGCNKCKTLEQRLIALKEKHGLSFELQKVSDLDEIVKDGVMMTPGLVFDGTLRSVITVPKDNQLLSWIEETSA
jgi:small redox-active disulfide protein 2